MLFINIYIYYIHMIQCYLLIYIFIIFNIYIYYSTCDSWNHFSVSFYDVP